MKNGFKVLDSDLHTMEPDGLWERYLDEPFKKFAPKFTRREDNAPEPAGHQHRQSRAGRVLQARADGQGRQGSARALVRSPSALCGRPRARL